MHILFVQQQPCIRALKYISGIKEIAPKVDISFAYIGKTLTEFYGHGDEMVKTWIELDRNAEEELQEYVDNHKVDIIHCHNAPDTLTNICIDLFKGEIPIVHDIHDLMSARHTTYEDGVETSKTVRDWREEEKRAIEKSDAVITVANEILNIAKGHGFIMPKYTLIYPNYLPGKYVPEEVPSKKLKPYPASIVYEGFVSSDVDSHYYFIDIFRAIAAQGYEIHIYPSRDNEDYEALGESHANIYYHHRLKPAKLYKELLQYDYGWCGFNDAVNKQHLDTVLPNKFFEYIACGLPVLSFPHKTLKKVINEKGVGLIISDVHSLREKLENADLGAMMNKVLASRHDYTVESNLPKVLSLYNELIRGSDLSS